MYWSTKEPKEAKENLKKYKKTELETSQYVISKHITDTYNQNSKVLGSKDYLDHWNNIESQETNPHIHSKLTHKK